MMNKKLNWKICCYWNKIKDHLNKFKKKQKQKHNYSLVIKRKKYGIIKNVRTQRKRRNHSLLCGQTFIHILILSYRLAEISRLINNVWAYKKNNNSDWSCYYHRCTAAIRHRRWISSLQHFFFSTCACCT